MESFAPNGRCLASDCDLSVLIPFCRARTWWMDLKWARRKICRKWWFGKKVYYSTRKYTCTKLLAKLLSAWSMRYLQSAPGFIQVLLFLPKYYFMQWFRWNRSNQTHYFVIESGSINLVSPYIYQVQVSKDVEPLMRRGSSWLVSLSNFRFGWTLLTFVHLS